MNSLKLSHIVIYIGIIATTNCLGFLPCIQLGITKILSVFVVLFLLTVILLNSYKKIRDALFYKEILLLIFLPFASSIPCYVYRGQDFITTFIATRSVLLFAIYFLLHKVNFNDIKLKQIFFAVAVIATLIYLFQQIFYPSLILFGDGSSEKVSIRNGFYRFRLFYNNPYIFFAFFLCVVSSIKEKKRILWSFFFLVGIFLTLTRQIWMCCLLPVIMYPILTKNKIEIKVCGIIVGSLILYLLMQAASYGNNSLLQQTQQQLNDDNDVRMLSLNFYGLEYWVDGWNVAFGNGIPSFGKSNYGNFISSLEERGLYRSDIGIVGVFSQYGAIYIFALLLYYVKIFRNFKYLSKELQMLYIASALNLPLASWDIFPLYLGCITYMADCEIKKAKENYSYE